MRLSQAWVDEASAWLRAPMPSVLDQIAQARDQLRQRWDAQQQERAARLSRSQAEPASSLNLLGLPQAASDSRIVSKRKQPEGSAYISPYSNTHQTQRQRVDAQGAYISPYSNTHTAQRQRVDAQGAYANTSSQAPPMTTSSPHSVTLNSTSNIWNSASHQPGQSSDTIPTPPTMGSSQVVSSHVQPAYTFGAPVNQPTSTAAEFMPAAFAPATLALNTSTSTPTPAASYAPAPEASASPRPANTLSQVHPPAEASTARLGAVASVSTSMVAIKQEIAQSSTDYVPTLTRPSRSRNSPENILTEVSAGPAQSSRQCSSHGHNVHETYKTPARERTITPHSHSRLETSATSPPSEVTMARNDHVGMDAARSPGTISTTARVSAAAAQPKSPLMLPLSRRQSYEPTVVNDALPPREDDSGPHDDHAEACGHSSHQSPSVGLKDHPDRDVPDHDLPAVRQIGTADSPASSSPLSSSVSLSAFSPRQSPMVDKRASHQKLRSSIAPVESSRPRQGSRLAPFPPHLESSIEGPRKINSPVGQRSPSATSVTSPITIEVGHARDSNSPRQTLGNVYSDRRRQSVARSIVPRPQEAAEETGQDSPASESKISQPDWYKKINLQQIKARPSGGGSNTGVDAKLGKFKSLVRRCAETQEKERSLLFDDIRKELHQLVFLEVNDVAVRRAQMLHEATGLPQIFAAEYSKGVEYPWDLKADAFELYNRWCTKTFSVDLLRGIVRSSKNNRATDRIEPGIVDKSGAAYYGQGNLINGQWWPTQLCTVRDGAHGSTQGGVYAVKGKPAFSIIVSGGSQYNDRDEGEELWYSGTYLGADSPDSKHSDNTQSLILNVKENKAVRVIRSHKIHKNHSRFRPLRGFRFDGIYDVVGYEVVTAAQGGYVFHMVRRPGQDPIRAEGVSIRPTGKEIAEYDKIKKFL